MAKGQKSDGNGVENLRKVLLKQYRDPVRLRVGLAVLMAAGWYFAAYGPMVARIDKARKGLEEERKKLELAENIDVLREEVKRFQGHLPPRPDPNEAMQYLLDGIKAMPVRLTALDPSGQRDFGPYKVVLFQLAAEGTYGDLDGLLRWVEANPRVLRVDSIRIGASEEKSSVRPGAGTADEGPRYSISMTVVGVLG